LPDERPLAGFREVLRDLTSWLDAASIQGAVIGGLAASLLGRPRVTNDVDVLVLVEEQAWPDLLASGERFGFLPRIADPLSFLRRSHVLLLRHQPSAIDLDMSVGGLPFEEEVVRRSTRVEIGDVSIPLISAEDLLIMKAVAHRPRDLIDIEAVLERQDNLDLGRVQSWVREFSSALDAPEIFENFQDLLRKRRRRGR
jgi:hypothetical protein